MKKPRINLLDGFRFLAVLAVMLGHYAYRWTPPVSAVNLYPYGSFFGSIFKYGAQGVIFFFIISGFVISYTLENTSGISTFFKNRFVRLFPPMLACSVVTFLVCIVWDKEHYFPWSHELRNFLPSLTFTKPTMWHALTHKEFSYISLSYWTLWVEVQFYILAALLYYGNKKTFLRNLVLIAILLNILNVIPESIANPENYRLPGWWRSISVALYHDRSQLDLPLYISWFTIGAIFHRLFKFPAIAGSKLILIGGLALFAQQFLISGWSLRIIYLVMIGLFTCLVYKKAWLNFLNFPFILRVGVISYTVYLIHEIIGVMIINKFGGYLGKASPLAPLIAVGLIFGLAELSYRLYEKRATLWLKQKLTRPERIRPVAEPVFIAETRIIVAEPAMIGEPVFIAEPVIVAEPGTQN